MSGARALQGLCLRQKPNTTISALLATLKLCSSSRDLERGKQTHADAIDCGYGYNMCIASATVYMYAKCSSMVDAKRVFDKMLCHDLVAWSALILGYAENGQEDLALELFAALKLPPNGQVYVAALKACGNLAAKEEGCLVHGRLVKVKALGKAMEIHSQAVEKNCCDFDIILTNSLVDLYAKCGSLVDARAVFDRSRSHNVVTWTALMLGCTENGEEQLAYELFQRMQHKPDALSLATVLSSCSALAMKEEGKRIDGEVVKLNSLEKGMKIHSLAAKWGFDKDHQVANGLVDMYSKSGSMIDAWSVFDGIFIPTAVSWTALMLGYAKAGQGELALLLLAAQRQQQFCQPEAVMFVAALKVCCSVVSLGYGKAIHGEICKFGLENDSSILSCLVDLYGKCGSVLEAQLAFDSAAAKDSVIFSALMSGYSREGKAQQVFDLFHRMREEGLWPDAITFLSVLGVCSHAGFVERGKRCFEEMQRGFGIPPEIEHYHCVIDMLSRGNQLDEAVRIIKSMRLFKPTVVTWGIVLAGCKKWKNVEMGKLAFDSLMELGDQNGAGCTLMSSIISQEQRLT